MYIALLPMDGVRGRSEDASPAVMDDAAAIGSRVRRGHIPVRFELSSLDLTSVGPPEPTYVVLVRRTATFLHYIPDLIDSFAKHVADGSRDVWLECSVLGPLQWQYPVGVLFDCQAGSSGDRAGILPYRLVVHFSGFPAQCVMRPVTSSLGKCPGEFHFIHSLKQAFFMQCGTTNPVMDLSSAELHALWRSCVEDVANEESIVQPALATRSSRRLPVRFIMVREEQEPDLRTRAGGIRCYQRPISATKEWTISTAFQHVVNDADITSLPFKFSVHGIVLPGDTPIERLCRHLSHPDHFVYICCCRIPDHSNT
ncbi:Autophagy protein Apg5 [Plasmodiophora brassicae]